MEGGLGGANIFQFNHFTVNQSVRGTTVDNGFWAIHMRFLNDAHEKKTFKRCQKKFARTRTSLAFRLCDHDEKCTLFFEVRACRLFITNLNSNNMCINMELVFAEPGFFHGYHCSILAFL
jgi:hypothetical protein